MTRDGRQVATYCLASKLAAPRPCSCLFMFHDRARAHRKWARAKFGSELGQMMFEMAVGVLSANGESRRQGRAQTTTCQFSAAANTKRLMQTPDRIHPNWTRAHTHTHSNCVTRQHALPVARSGSWPPPPPPRRPHHLGRSGANLSRAFECHLVALGAKRSHRAGPSST